MKEKENTQENVVEEEKEVAFLEKTKRAIKRVATKITGKNKEFGS